MSSSGSTEQSAGGPQAARENAPTPPAVMHPELFMAACHGDHEQLVRLVAGAGTAVSEGASSAVVIEIGGRMHDATLTEPASSQPASSLLLLTAATPDGNSALHVVAAAGDSDEYLDSARVIYGGASQLLGAQNRAGSTPLHRAARARNVSMLSLLLDLAASSRVLEILRTRNGVGETALHEAIRAGDMAAVRVLMAADPCLARVPPPDDGASPLFLAVSLCRYDIARELHAMDDQLSYAGPRGQNTLHAAVLRSTEMTELLLGWNKHLTKQQDQHGKTPLHFAVSLESETYELIPQHAVPVKQGRSVISLLNIREPPLELAKQLLDADVCSAYQPDKQGSYPIHMAASAGRLSALRILITRYSGCAALCDSDGRTFLHVAVKKERYDIVAFACEKSELSTILNMQDNDGNTALHLAVEVGNWWIFACLLLIKNVDFNLLNNRQHTPLELSINSIPTGLHNSVLDSRFMIQETLLCANATRGIYWQDADAEKEFDPQIEAENEKKGSDIVSGSTQFLSIGLVLITTMTFGATFALPGGYRADDHEHGGTPTLAQEKLFQAFIMANTLAFFCSSLAVLSLVYAGTPTIELPLRYMHYNISIWLSLNAVGSLATAFTLAVYIMMTPVAAKTVVAVIVVIFSIGVPYISFLVVRYYLLLVVLYIRLGIMPILRSSLFKVMLIMFWPLFVIFGWQVLASMI